MREVNRRIGVREISSAQEDCDGFTFEIGRRDVDFSILIEISDGKVPGTRSSLKRRTWCHREPLVSSEKHRDSTSRRCDEIHSIVSIDVREDYGECA